MKWYQYQITEMVIKTVWVEAESEEEAEEMAMDEDLEKELDYCDRKVLLLETDYEEH